MGLLVEIGRGGMGSADAQAVLNGLDRRRAPATAPPQGLCLDEVIY